MEGYSTFYIIRPWHKYKSLSWTKKEGDINWRIRPNTPLNKLDENNNVYFELEALYDYNSSNLWELHTENDICLYNGVTFKRIEIKQSCSFNRRTGPIRFEFGEFGMIRDSIARSEGDLKNLVFQMRIHVAHKSTVGIQIPPADNFLHSKNIDTEVVLRLDSERYPHHIYVDRLALTTVSSKFCEIFSNEPNNNREYSIENIYNSTNFEKYPIDDKALMYSVQFLYRRKQKFRIDTIEGILYFAVRYNIQFLTVDCEEFLISNREISNTKKLCLAEECSLPKLQLAVLDSIKIEIFQQEGLDIFEAFHEMGPKTLKALLVMFCEEDFEPYN